MLRDNHLKKAFPLYDDREIFKTSNKENYDLLTTKLIEHKQDDDYDTDIDVVDDHVEMCLEELRETIENFVNGDPLKLCRNARGEFSGIQRIDCREEEDLASSPDSSWYDMESYIQKRAESERKSEAKNRGRRRRKPLFTQARRKSRS